MKKITFGQFLGCIMLMLPMVTSAQKDSTQSKFFLTRIINKMTGDSLDPGKPRLLLYPTLGYTPETSWEIGLSALALFHAKNDVHRSRLSEIQAFTFYTVNRQVGLWMDHAIYTKDNNWFFLGRWRWQQFPLLYYGIGPDTPKSDYAVVDGEQGMIRQRILRKIKGNLFFGPQLDWQAIYEPNFSVNEGPMHMPPGTAGSSNLGLGAGLVFDTRENVLNVRKGYFAEVAWFDYQRKWGSDFSFTNLTLDFRGYWPMKNPDQVLAVQAFGQFQGGQAPFNQLALLGGDGLMRGYYLGRFRDRNYAAVAAEYRFLPFPFSKRFGGTVFASAGTVSPRLRQMQWRNIKPAAGIGLRYLIFPGKDIYVRVDFAFTPEGNGFYFYNGEAF
jgi:hypothetical protein